MKPSVDELCALAPDVPRKLVEAHCDRLEDAYFRHFHAPTVAAHLRAIAGMPEDAPASVLIDRGDDGHVDCTILAFDRPGIFSLLTGLLASMSFRINSGAVFTYGRLEAPATVRPGSSGHKPTPDPVRRRRIIDQFRGQIDDEASIDAWAERFRARVGEVLRLVEQGDDGTRRAKQRVNEWVTAALSRRRGGQLPVLYPVQVLVDERGGRNRMRITGQDTPAFLYTLAAALHLQDLHIESVRISSHHGRVEDEVRFVSNRGRPIRDEAALERVRFSVLLTKQFSYFLDTAPDPYAALARFEKMVGDIARQPEAGQWWQMLANPRTMSDLARVLGASNYLWEDFIRLQYESLLPLCKPHLSADAVHAEDESLERRLRDALDGAVGLAEQKDRINRFKDREVFLIDLEHLLDDRIDFRQFGNRLTRLADAMVTVACECVYADLVRSWGDPQTQGRQPATYSVFGLGKLGGRALGYASDIELLFIYSDTGKTAGGTRGRVTNTEFYITLVQDLLKFIRAKREGIFAIDLRLRPFGRNGPMASSVEQFESYYGKGGQAHAAERLALVRLRHVGGDLAVGRRIEQARDRIAYESDLIDSAAIWDLRRKQYDQKAGRAQLNAKYSCGALVDLEYTVQLLQVIYNDREPKLRTPSVYDSLGCLGKLKVLDAGEADHLIAAYRFLRRLINGLRMLRGNARDLALPPFDADEAVHLARRLGYRREGWLSPARQLIAEFHVRTATVRRFVERQFSRASLPDPTFGSVADVVLSDVLETPDRHKLLEQAGFKDATAAMNHIIRMRSMFARDDVTLAHLMVLAVETLRYEPDADLALQRWSALWCDGFGAERHVVFLREHTRAFEIMLSVFARDEELSRMLSDQASLEKLAALTEEQSEPESFERVRQRLVRTLA